MNEKVDQSSIIVTGVHRSGTSLCSHLLTHLSGELLLDDPEWAITSSEGAIAFIKNKELKRQMESYRIIKCPRMVEHIETFLSEFPQFSAFCVFRHPVDVFRSVEKAVLYGSGLSYTMADYQRMGWDGPLEEVFCKYYNFCLERILYIKERYPQRVKLIHFDFLIDLRKGEYNMNIFPLNSIDNNIAFDWNRDWAPEENQPPNYSLMDRSINPKYRSTEYIESLISRKAGRSYNRVLEVFKNTNEST